MGDFSGNAQYDAATANWGGSWLMPTSEQMKELVENCEWEWTQINGVNGSKVTGTNGACIFFPAAGYRFGSSIYDDGNYGHYWSSIPDDNIIDNRAYYLGFLYDYEGVLNGGRANGFTVCPITE